MRSGSAYGVPVNGVDDGAGAGAGVGAGTVAAAAALIQLMSATVPPDPFASKINFSPCTPAGRVTPLFENVCQVVHAPVSGSATAPVTLVPSTVRCAAPPVPLEATRNEMS